MRKLIAIALLTLFSSALVACHAVPPAEQEEPQDTELLYFTAHYSSDMGGERFTQDEILQRELAWVTENLDHEFIVSSESQWWHSEDYTSFNIEHTDDAVLITVELTTPSTALSDVIMDISAQGITLRPLYIADPAGAAITHWTITIELEPTVTLYDDFHLIFKPGAVPTALLAARENARTQ
ncbi:MAG: hypothetical protein FWD06_05890 [Oscillospiraceae bacterium]|nr:hypothetical protein [Oscillospiraceae bacterium]